MKKHLISPQGFAKLKSEWEELKYRERPQMLQQVQDAAADGDRSENTAYTYGRMRIREIDQRLRQLDRLLDGAIIQDSPKETGEVIFGSKVTVKDSAGKEFVYAFVGTAEIDPLKGLISLQSPIGKALQNKKVGDKATVNTPGGQRILTITDISTYE